MKKLIFYYAIALLLISCGDGKNSQNSTSDELPDDFSYTGYWENNSKVKDSCGRTDSLCIEEHWFNIGEPAGLSYILEIPTSSADNSSSCSAEVSYSSNNNTNASSGGTASSSSYIVMLSSSVMNDLSSSSEIGSVSNDQNCIYNETNSELNCTEKIYKTTIIQNKVWMAENLNFETLTGSYCYDDDDSNCVNFGRLYEWNTAMDSELSTAKNPSIVQGICPNGWHLPSDAEWESMLSFVAGAEQKEGKLEENWTEIGGFLKSTSGWYNSGNGTDKYGFAVKPGGMKSINYESDLRSAYFWSSTEETSDLAWSRKFGYSTDMIYRGMDGSHKGIALSIRCVKD